MFTAHPTEAVRRALLEKERQIVGCLVADIDRGRTPAERRADRERMRLALTASWQTAQAPPEKPSVADEFEHVGFYLSDVLYRVLPVFHEVFEDALRDAFGARRLPRCRPCSASAPGSAATWTATPTSAPTPSPRRWPASARWCWPRTGATSPRSASC